MIIFHYPLGVNNTAQVGVGTMLFLTGGEAPVTPGGTGDGIGRTLSIGLRIGLCFLLALL